MSVLFGTRGGVPRRLMWCVLIAVLAGLTLSDCCNLLAEYLKFPVVIDHRHDVDPSMAFPAITVCNVNPLRKSALCDQMILRGTHFPRSLHARICGERAPYLDVSYLILGNMQ